MRIIQRGLACAAATLLIAGLAGNVAAATPPQNAGFLADYSKLQPVEGKEGVLRYLDKSVDLRPYTKLMIEPVQVFLAPNPEYKGLQVDTLKRMSDAYQQAFVNAVSSGYQVVTQPGPDVLRIRLAITGVQPTSPPLGATDFIPIKAIFNLGRAAAGAAPKVAEISGEFELLAPDGKVVAAAVATRKSEKTLAQGDKITWNDLQEIVNAWAKTLRQRLDEARGVAPPPAK